MRIYSWVLDWEAFDLAVQWKGNLCLKFAANALFAEGKLSLSEQAQDKEDPTLTVICSCGLE